MNSNINSNCTEIHSYLVNTLAFWILFAAASALFFMAVSILGTTRRPMGDGLFISSTTLRAFTPFPLILTGLLNDCFSSSLSLCSNSYMYKQSLSNNQIKIFLYLFTFETPSVNVQVDFKNNLAPRP